MKTYSTLLVIREMQTKTTMRASSDLLDWLLWEKKNQKITSVGEDVRNWNPDALLVGMQSSAATPLPDVYPDEVKGRTQLLFTPTFTAALFSIAKT